MFLKKCGKADMRSEEYSHRRGEVLVVSAVDSLKTRITLLTLAIFLLAVWSLSFYASRMLRDDVKRMVGEQQFSSVSLLAAQVNNDLAERLQVLEKMGDQLSRVPLGMR